MPGKKILVVDDEPHVLMLLEARLELKGYQMVTAVNGDEAIMIAMAESPDLIILDIMMPKVDGFKVLQSLKSHDLTKAIPVIMLSGKGDIQSMTKGEELGASDYFIKPYNSEELLKCIAKHIGEGNKDS